jgi:serine/threonine-protein kinase
MSTTLSDRYQLHELVGSGAAGRVYRARDLRLGRDVAVKRLRADALGGTETRARFAREAHALARVSDPHVLAVFDVSTDADDSFFVTDYCPDGSLADRLRQGALTSCEVRALAHDVGAGLVAIHSAGIVHRDIKPSNILRLGGRWVIGDLGIARVDGDASLTYTGSVIGTPEYWAPETARGAVSTPAVDVYGLGCVLFEALSGRPPFRGDTPLATGLLHANAATPPLPEAIREDDPHLAEFVMRLLAKNPASRPVAVALDRELGAGNVHEPVATPPDTVVATVAMTTPILPPTVAYPPGSLQRGRRSSRSGLAVGALGLLAAVGVLLLARDDGGPGPAAITGSAGVPTTTSSTTPRSTPLTPSTRSVPSLEGLSVASATAALRTRGLELAIGGTAASSAPPGSIIGQVPAANRHVPPGSRVSVTLSDGPTRLTTVQAGSPADRPKKQKPAGSHGHGKHGHGNQQNSR